MCRTIFSLLVLISISANAQEQINFSNVKKLDAKVNSNAEEMMPLLSNDGTTLYFVRARHDENEGGANSGHDIWSSNVQDAKYSEANNNFGKLNNLGNNAIVGISKDNSKIYLLNAYKTDSKVEKGIALTDKNFSKPSFVEIEGMDYSSEFYGFYINSNETVMFISMKGPDSYGKEDLYVSIKEQGRWQKPIHLSSEINSQGFEMSPSLSLDESRLYFSSNGLGGAGDADIFYAERVDEGWTNWGPPVNLGSNVNSTAFDAYFSEGSDSIAYFSSSRETQNSDIYSVDITRNDETLEQPIEIIEDTAQLQKEPITEKNPPLADPSIGNIYFDNNRYFIRKDAKENLDQLVKVMKEMPNLHVTLQGHADKTYLAKSNQILSENRSKEAKKYLVNQGIASSRISIIGYGENKPLVPCEDCTDAQLQKNRRVEFKLEFK